MVRKFYKSSPVPRFRICDPDKCESLGEFNGLEQDELQGDD